MDASPPERTAPLRTGGAARELGVVGVTRSIPRLTRRRVEYSLGMRRDIARASAAAGPTRCWSGPGTWEFAAG